MEKPYGRKGEFLLLLKKNKQNNIREVAEQPRKKRLIFQVTGTQFPSTFLPTARQSHVPVIVKPSYYMPKAYLKCISNSGRGNRCLRTGLIQLRSFCDGKTIEPMIDQTLIALIRISSYQSDYVRQVETIRENKAKTVPIT